MRSPSLSSYAMHMAATYPYASAYAPLSAHAVAAAMAAAAAQHHAPAAALALQHAQQQQQQQQQHHHHQQQHQQQQRHKAEMKLHHRRGLAGGGGGGGGAPRVPPPTPVVPDVPRRARSVPAMGAQGVCRDGNATPRAECRSALDASPTSGARGTKRGAASATTATPPQSAAPGCASASAAASCSGNGIGDGAASSRSAAASPPRTPRLKAAKADCSDSPSTPRAGQATCVKAEASVVGLADAASATLPSSSQAGVPGAPTPNFANIYSFFAKMFDPQVTFDAISCVSEASMSPLDKEVVKLLMSNLEMNIVNKSFRQKLLDTYRQQLRQGVPETVS